MIIDCPEQVPILINHDGDDGDGMYLAECDIIAYPDLGQVGYLIDISRLWEYIANNYLYFNYQFGLKFSKTSRNRLILKWK